MNHGGAINVSHWWKRRSIVTFGLTFGIAPQVVPVIFAVMVDYRGPPEGLAPVTWLASYPRSGNTLLRIILNRCFGVSSQSIYSDEEFPKSPICDLVGHQAIGDDPKGFIANVLHRGRRLYVKTHELPPPDHHPTIYVLRDGRSAVISHAHYMRQILHRDITLTDIVLGKIGVSWSDHVKAWLRAGRPNLLVVRYEDLAVGKADTLAAISEFIGQPMIHAYDVAFDQLHALDPLFFRRGSDEANICELDGEPEQVFERLHGSTLRDFGYSVNQGVRARQNA